ncbi:MAG: hypothetical protein KGL34_07920 [Gammaproteobacteria bacterium]|nr:hypothetical protein [Gammaproteobacteria bacterium]
MRYFAQIGATLLGLAVSVAAAAAPQPKAVEAVWKKHELNFSFVGFTTHYSCEGLEEKLDLLLASAAARPDAKVVASCMAPMGGPEPISTARVTFHALVPSEAGASPGAGAPVAAQWRTVHLRAHSPDDLGEGDCELVEQFARRLLPLFTVRHVVDHMSCVPHQLQIGGVDLSFEVLAPLPKPAVNTRGRADR